jgi:prepilin-type N-terminal cleavage/methylation domain-containing protein
MDNHKNGFTLIEILVTVVILAILAAVALPSYQKYVVRAKLTDVLEYADATKLIFSEYYAETGLCPDVTVTGIKTYQPIPHIRSVSSSQDAIPCRDWVEIYFHIDGNSDPSLEDFDQGRVMLRGYLGGDGTIKWVCGFSHYTPEIKSVLPSTCHAELI